VGRDVAFHRHYYGDEPPRVEICPRLIAGPRKEPTILKCCLWEFDIEREGEVMVVPCRADIGQLRICPKQRIVRRGNAPRIDAGSVLPGRPGIRQIIRPDVAGTCCAVPRDPERLSLRQTLAVLSTLQR
jgi:hypothetical protein